MGMLELRKGAVCKTAGSAYAGSNPASPICIFLAVVGPCGGLWRHSGPLSTSPPVQPTIAVQTPMAVKGDPNIFRVIAGTPMTTITFDPPLMKPVTLKPLSFAQPRRARYLSLPPVSVPPFTGVV